MRQRVAGWKSQEQRLQAVRGLGPAGATNAKALLLQERVLTRNIQVLSIELNDCLGTCSLVGSLLAEPSWESYTSLHGEHKALITGTGLQRQ